MSGKYVIPELRGREPVDVIEYGTDHSPDEAIEFVYYLKTEGDIEDVARKVAKEETTGRWIGKGEPTPIFEEAQAEVMKLEKYADGEGIVHILSPLSNFNLDTSVYGLYYQIAMSSIGGPILEFVYYDRVSFIDFKLPPKLLKLFPGPKFGIEGTREFIGLGENDPIIGTIVKPCCGLTPKEVAEKCYQAALGGAVLMKDDEKMLNPPYCPLDEKVRLVSRRLREAEEETGRRVIYAPHINGRPDKMVELAKRAIDMGATGIMFNAVLAAGFGVLDVLASDSEIDVPIYVHSGGRSALSTGPRRIEDRVMAKFVRLLGGDYFQIGVATQRNVHVASLDQSLLDDLAYVFREEEMADIKPVLPVAAGGLGAANIGANLEAFGYDIACLAGSNILDHPDGPKAGAIAMYQAVEAYQKGASLEEYAKDHPELRAIIS